MRQDKGRRVGKTTAQLLKGIKTVNDILARDNVNGILNALDKAKPHIQDLIVIYIDRRNNRKYWNGTDDTTKPIATWMLETTKLELLNDDSEED